MGIDQLKDVKESGKYHEVISLPPGLIDNVPKGSLVSA